MHIRDVMLYKWKVYQLWLCIFFFKQLFKWTTWIDYENVYFLIVVGSENFIFLFIYNKILEKWKYIK